MRPVSYVVTLCPYLWLRWQPFCMLLCLSTSCSEIKPEEKERRTVSCDRSRRMKSQNLVTRTLGICSLTSGKMVIGSNSSFTVYLKPRMLRVKFRRGARFRLLNICSFRKLKQRQCWFTRLYDETNLLLLSI